MSEAEKDTVMIIKLSLERALVDGEIIDGPYPDRGQPVALSTRNIDKYWVLPVEGWEIVPLSMEEIRGEWDVGCFGTRMRWVQFNRIEWVYGNRVRVEMGLVYDPDFEWGITVWGLELYLEKRGSD